MHELLLENVKRESSIPTSEKEESMSMDYEDDDGKSSEDDESFYARNHSDLMNSILAQTADINHLYNSSSSSAGVDVKEEDGQFVHQTSKEICHPVIGYWDKNALCFDDEDSGKQYRFVLHRRNSKKADIYVCVRCKSRKKYVKINVDGAHFMVHPNSIPHVCYMTEEELRLDRIQYEQTRRAMKEARPIKPPALHNNMRARPSPKIKSKRSKYEITTLPLPSQSKNNIPSDLATFLSQKTLNRSSIPLPPSTPTVRPPPPVVIKHEPAPTIDFQTLAMNEFVSQCLKPFDAASLQLLESTISPVKKPVPDIAMKPIKIEENVSSNEEQKPPNLINDSFTFCLKKALEGIPAQHRSKAENDILYFVYTQLYLKYGFAITC